MIYSALSIATHLLIFFPSLCTSSVSHGDEQLGYDVLKGTSDDQNHDFISSPWQELVKHIVSEDSIGPEYSTTASMSDPSLQISHRATPLLPFKQSGLQTGSHSSFPTELVMLLHFKLEFFSLVFLVVLLFSRLSNSQSYI